ncbi:hypothetical protein [Psychroflexus aestuariivivens]|uniref:hypothetical protein n=1 Tax=Psychroflexus aestuariivivens TaxID=1795040 RepID=UPI000FD83A38|nr:hypothetical protein [Psychroflexus aestuariivivens]
MTNKENLTSETEYFIERTLHRLKNNLQTQMGLLQIQEATQRNYFNEKKVITDRMFALTLAYDSYHSNVKSDQSTEPQLPLQQFLSQFTQHLNVSEHTTQFKVSEIDEHAMKLNDILVLAYFIIEFVDFSLLLERKLQIDYNILNKNINLTFSFKDLTNYSDFKYKYESKFKIINILKSQLKATLEISKTSINLLIPIQ